MVPVIAPTPVPSISDDDYTTCSRENLKFFSGEAHDDCLNQLFGEMSSQMQSMSATMNYMMETFRKYIDINETSLMETIANVNDKVLHLEEAVDSFADFEEAVDSKISMLAGNMTALADFDADVDSKISMLTGNMSALADTFEEYLVDTKYKQPTIPPTPAPTRRRRSRRPTAEGPQE
jgi:hypothetical protein